jgi:acyl-coenzyme A thioesterase PaaI-like protein
MDADPQPVTPTFRHLPVCFGCGAENPLALGVTNAATTGGAESRVRFGADHQGAPGLVHGGLLAVLLDEAMGSVSHPVSGIRLTTEMKIRYRRPTPIEIDLVCRAHVATRSEGQFSVVATIAAVDDPDLVLVEGEATFVLARAKARSPEASD